MNFTDWFSLRH